MLKEITMLQNQPDSTVEHQFQCCPPERSSQLALGGGTVQERNGNPKKAIAQQVLLMDTMDFPSGSISKKK